MKKYKSYLPLLVAGLCILSTSTAYSEELISGDDSGIAVQAADGEMDDLYLSDVIQLDPATDQEAGFSDIGSGEESEEAYSDLILPDSEEATMNPDGSEAIQSSDEADELISSDADPVSDTAKSNAMFRMFNPNTGEHFYTASAAERGSLTKAGWINEGIGWCAPSTGGTKMIYRLYNPKKGSEEHHYSSDQNEIKALVAQGWKLEGPGWASAADSGIPVYRLFNAKARNSASSHHYTTDKNEKNALVSQGWRYEGIAWYGLPASTRGPIVYSIHETIVKGLENPLQLKPGEYYPFTVIGAGQSFRTENYHVEGDTVYVPAYWVMDGGTTKNTNWQVGSKSGLNQARDIPIKIYLQRQVFSEGKWTSEGYDYIAALVRTATYDSATYGGGGGSAFSGTSTTIQYNNGSYTATTYYPNGNFNGQSGTYTVDNNGYATITLRVYLG